MTVHLVKLAVGIDSVSGLAERQRLRLEAARTAGGLVRLRHVTRATPRRAAEILDGGSIYWVIRRAIRARQVILGIEPVVGDDGRTRCALILDPAIARVEPRPSRPFQGWRYLEAADAPRDSGAGHDGVEDLPDEIAEELRSLGLL